MTLLRDTIVRWIDSRVDHMLTAPPMWGSNEAVEMQMLLLTELRALATRPDQDALNPRHVLDRYVEFLKGKYPHMPQEPLFRLLGDAPNFEFTSVLQEFHSLITRATLPANPFEHSQVAIRLTFEAGQPPTASAVTGYYEEFRRAARSAARAVHTIARRQRDIEQATDFVLEESVVSQPNGAAGEVLLRLGMSSGQQNWEATNRVREALSSVITVAEWAATDSPLGDLSIDELSQRTHTAVQALRLLPRRGVKSVCVGGKFLARSKPVEIRQEHEHRFLEIVGDGAPPEEFDRTDEIRAIDLDRGVIVLGRKDRTPCFVRPEHLADLNEVGVNAHVTGRYYRRLGSRGFVLASCVTPESSPSD